MKLILLKVLLLFIPILISMVLSEALSNKQKRPTNIYRNKFKVNPAKSALTKIFDHIKNNKRPIPVKNKPLQNSKRKQFIIPRPRPAGFFDNNLARAFLIPAIPTLIGNCTYVDHVNV